MNYFNLCYILNFQYLLKFNFFMDDFFLIYLVFS